MFNVSNVPLAVVVTKSTLQISWVIPLRWYTTL